MTTAVFPGIASYTVSGTGPYPFNFEFDLGSIAVTIELAESSVPLYPGDYTLSPTQGDAGTITLTSATAATYAGEKIQIARATPLVQGWEGMTDREAAIEAALDKHMRALQDIDRKFDPTLRDFLVPEITRWHRLLTPDATVRMISSGQSPVTRDTTIPDGETFPALDPARNLIFDPATNLFTDGNTSGGMSQNYVPLFAQRIIDRTTLNFQTIQTGQGATGIEKWSGSAADRSTHTITVDDVPGGTALGDVELGDTLTWPAVGVEFPDGSGVVTDVTDNGGTGTVKLRITSGRSPADNYQLYLAGVKVGRVNGAPDISNREQFVEIVDKFDKSGWTDPLHFFVWGGMEANGLLASETLLYLKTEFWDVFIADLETIGIVGPDTRIAIVESYHELLGETHSVDYSRAHEDQFVIAHSDKKSRGVFVSTFDLEPEPAEAEADQAVHLGFEAIQQVPGRFERALTQGRDGPNPAVLNSLDAYGRLGFIPGVTRNAVTADKTLVPEECMGGIVMVDTSGGDVTITLPDLVNVPAWVSVRNAFTVTLNVTDASNTLTIDGNGKNFRTPTGRTSLSTIDITGVGLVHLMYRGNWYISDGTRTSDGRPQLMRDSDYTLENSADPTKRLKQSVVLLGSGTTMTADIGAFRHAHYKTRAEAIAATVDPEVATISFPVSLALQDQNADTHIVAFQRDTQTLGATGAALVTAGGVSWVPCGDTTPLHFGQDKMGVKSWTGTVPAPNRLSDVFGSLGAAQAIYPKATALTESVDAHAVQKAFDYVRDRTVSANGGKEMGRNTGNNSTQQVRLVFPQAVYYTTRPFDMTGVRFGYGAWNLHFENATILGACPGKTIFDLTYSRNCQFTGVANVVGLWVAAGICRSGIQTTRQLNGNASDGHSFTGARIRVMGRFSLGGYHSYASEYVGFGMMGLLSFNDLDNRVFHCDFDGSDGVLEFTNGESVTWPGSGTGVVKYNSSGQATGDIAIRVITGTLADDTQITGTTSGKVADINGTPRQEPDGEGPGGSSYCMVLDGDNYWEISSDYQDDPAADTPASFLQNHGIFDARHTGNGSAVWICRAEDHNFEGAYAVSLDNAAGAGFVVFANTGAEAVDGLKLSNVHIESDAGDTDSSTGIRHGIRFESATSGRNVVAKGFELGRNKGQVSVGVFAASSDVDSVQIVGDIEVREVGRDDGQLMFEDPGKFTVDGRLACYTDGTGPFFNVADLAGVSGLVECADVTSPNVLHPTGTYVLQDLLGSRVFRGAFRQSIDPATGFAEIIAADEATGAQLARIRYNASADRYEFLLGGSGNDYAMSGAAFNPLGAQNLGAAAAPWNNVIATSYRDQNNVQVVGTQQSAIADDASGEGNQATVNAILAALRAHGLIVT